MTFKEVILSANDASTEAKVAALAVLLDKELLRLAETVLNVQKLQGPQGEQGLQGPKGEQGDRGFDGTNGKDGTDGAQGPKGEDGKDGVGVQDAKIDFDGSLIITLTDGRELNVGEVVPMDVSEKIKVIGNGGGTSQGVLDAIAAIQATIASYGTMATQNANNVAITGGAIDGTPIGATTAAAGTFTTLIGGSGSANYGQLTGSATTKAVEFKTLGSDTNVSFAIRPKGTGAIDLAAGSSGVNISNGGTVTAITGTSNGTGYTSIPSVTISPPTTAGGVQATANAQMAALTVAVNGGGTGYTVGDVLTLVGGTFSTAAQVSVSTVSAGVITAIAFVQGGTYSVLPSNPLSVTGGTGTGATINVTAWQVRGTAFTITNAGSGYVEQPTVSFSGGGGSGAAAYATVGSATTIKGLGASTVSTVTNASLVFYTPNTTVPAFIVREVAASDSFVFISPNTGYSQVVAGGNTNASLKLASNGTGSVFLNTQGTSETNQMRVAHTASAVNYVQVTGAATTASPTISAQGSDANVRLTFSDKASGGIQFNSGSGARQFYIGPVPNAVNYFYVNGNVTGSAPVISVAGTDTNIDLTLTPKGTGVVQFGSYTASALLPVAGYITIKDSGGTTRRLLVG